MTQCRLVPDPDWVIEEYIELRDRFFANVPDDQDITDEQEHAFDVWFLENASQQLKQYMEQKKRRACRK